MFGPDWGLSFGPNKHGKSNIFGVIALAPAYLFGVLGLFALGKLGWSAMGTPAAEGAGAKAPALVADAPETAVVNAAKSTGVKKASASSNAVATDPTTQF
jgi:hypothetical protein